MKEQFRGQKLFYCFFFLEQHLGGAAAVTQRTTGSVPSYQPIFYSAKDTSANISSILVDLLSIPLRMAFRQGTCQRRRNCVGQTELAP